MFVREVSTWDIATTIRHKWFPAAAAAITCVVGLKVTKMLVRILTRPSFPGPGLGFLVRFYFKPVVDQLADIMSLTGKYGGIYSIRTPIKEIVVVSDIGIYRDIMTRRPKEFGGLDNDPLFDSVSLPFLEGEQWKKHRKIDSRPLTESNVNNSVSMIKSVSMDMVQRCRRSADKDGVVLWHAVDDLRRSAARVAAAIYMGESDPVNAASPLFSSETCKDVWDFIEESMQITLMRTRFLYRDRLLCRLAFPGVRKHIARMHKIKSMMLDNIRSAGHRSSGLIQSLPEAARGHFNDGELISALILYFTGGGETTGSTTSWVLYYMARDPNIQARARAEIDSVGDITPQNIPEMPFIHACVLEAMRLSHPVKITTSRALVDCTVAGKRISAGTGFVFLLGAMLRGYAEYEDGHLFRPERWMLRDGSSLDQEKVADLLVFGFGPRNCPGKILAMKEMVVFVATLLRNFKDISVAEGGDVGVQSSSLFSTTPVNLILRMRCRSLDT